MTRAALLPTRYLGTVLFTVGAAAALMAMRSDPKPAPAKPSVLRIVARDFAYDLPASVPSGPVRIELVNHGQNLHHAQLVRLEQGKTLRDLASFPHDAPPPSWVVMVGGPGAVGPGDSSAVFETLPPGNYAVLCFIPSADNIPHVAMGMAAGFTVTPSGTRASMPKAETTVRLVDFGFAPSGAFHAGRQIIRVVNDAAQPHEIVIFQLLPGKTPSDLFQWQMTLQGPPPARLIGGTVGLSQSGEALVDVTLEPGDYVFTCFIPDAKDGKPHFMHGMSLPFTVAAH
jgi:hypothetical protein